MWKMLFWARSDLPTSEFQHRWRREHGPLIAAHADRIGLYKYVQNHRIVDELDDAERSERPLLEQQAASLDILDEWYFESRERLAAALHSPEGQESFAEIIASERRIATPSRCQLHHVHEFPQINPSPETIIASQANRIVKTIAMALPHPADPRPLDLAHWLTHHTPIVRRVAPILGILRYVGSHSLSLLRPMPTEDDLIVRLRGLRGAMGVGVPDFQGVSCEWQSIDDARRWTLDPEKIAARREIFTDENDLAGEGVFFMAKEHVFVDRHRH